MKRYIVTLLFSISFWLVKLCSAQPKEMDTNLTLYLGDTVHPTSHHGSHSSHSSHHSHYSCMLTNADSIGNLSSVKLKFIKDNIQNDASAIFVKSFKAKASAEAGYDGKNGFMGDAIFVVVKYDYSGKPHYKQYRVCCLAIPLESTISDYYIFYKDFDKKDEMNLYIESIGNSFLSKEYRSGCKVKKESWMDKL